LIPSRRRSKRLKKNSRSGCGRRGIRHLRRDGRFAITPRTGSNQAQARATIGGGGPDRSRDVDAPRHDGNVKTKPQRNAGPNKARHDARSRENSSALYALICVNPGRPDHYGSRTNIEHVAAQHGNAVMQ
jgi:hypothetical protein